MQLLIWHHDTRRNDIQHNDTQHNETQHNNTNAIFSIQHYDTQHNAEPFYAECQLCPVSHPSPLSLVPLC
jgi:hypothetical protein